MINKTKAGIDKGIQEIMDIRIIFIFLFIKNKYNMYVNGRKTKAGLMYKAHELKKQKMMGSK